jgi:hypothetical protein
MSKNTIEKPKTELVVSPERIESVVTDLLGYEIDDDGYILNKAGERIESTEREPIPIDEIGYLGSGPNGEIEPVPDNFASTVSYLSDRSIETKTKEEQTNE